MKKMYLLLFSLTMLAVLSCRAELEPNNHFLQANTITLNLAVNGTLDTAIDASDYFKFNLSQDALLVTTIGKDTGLLFNALIFGNNDTLNAISDFWGPQDSVQCSNEVPLSAGTYYIQLHALGGMGAYSMNLSLQLPFYSPDTEPNDSPSLALPLNVSVTGVLGYWKGYNNRDIQDWYSITNTTDDTITLRISKSAEYYLSSCLFDSAMNKIASDSGAMGDTYFEYSAPIAAGNYKALVSLPGNGFGSYNIIVHFDYPVANGLNETAETLLQAYPNPASNVLHVKIPSQTITIYNLQGELMQQQSGNQAGTDVEVSTLPGGVYLLKAVTGTQTTQCRFVKL